MSIPDVQLTIKDGALGLTPAASPNVVALVGVCSVGTPLEVNSFGAGNPQAIKDKLGVGPLVEAACMMNGAGVEVVTVNATPTAGSNSAVTQTGTGTSVMTLTGTPLDDYTLKVRVEVGATGPTAGTAQFSYSLDGGKTYSSPIALPIAGTYAVPNTGLTLNFAAGTLVAGDIYSATCTGPTYDLTAGSAALDALLADPREWFVVLMTGVPADVSSLASLFAAVGTKMTNAQAAARYVRALIQAPDVSDATLIPALPALADTRVGIAAGFETVLSSLSTRQVKRGAAWTIAKRLGLIPPSEAASRVRTGPVGSEVLALLRDERVTPALDQLNVATMRTIVGLPGFYVTNARIKASPTSDFQYFELGRVMDIACRAARVAWLQYLNEDLLVSKDDGTIDEVEARRIEAFVTNQVRNAVVTTRWASDASVVVDRTEQILSTETLKGEVRIVPKGYARHISVQIGFFNPALAAAAA